MSLLICNLAYFVIQELIHYHSRIALQYREEILQWADLDFYDRNVLRVQLPYVAPAVTPGLSVEQQKERKRELARRLMEINARKREERVRNLCKKKKLNASNLYFIVKLILMF